MKKLKHHKGFDPTFGGEKEQAVRINGLKREDFDKSFEAPLFFHAYTLSGHTLRVKLERGAVCFCDLRFTWEGCLKAFRHLPSEICRECSFVPGTPDEKLVLAWINAEYSAIAHWLEYLVLGTRGIEDFFTEKLAIKPRAELSKAIFDVATEILPRNPDLQHYFKTPLEIWWQWECALCRHNLWGNGLLTGVPSFQAQLSKRLRSELIRSGSQQLDLLDNTPGETTIAKSEVKSFDSIYAAWDELLFSTALEDKTFRRHKAMTEYKRKLSSWARECRSPRFLVPELKKGRLVTKSLPKNE